MVYRITFRNGTDPGLTQGRPGFPLNHKPKLTAL